MFSREILKAYYNTVIWGGLAGSESIDKPSSMHSDLYTPGYVFQSFNKYLLSTYWVPGALEYTSEQNR